MNCALVGFVLGAAGCLLCRGQISAATIQTTGAGSAVSVTNLTATFDVLTSNTVVQLENYTEGGLNINIPGRSWAADTSMAPIVDPFHGASGTNLAFYAISTPVSDWVSIQTANLAAMYGVEFLYGNIWSNVASQPIWGNSQAVVDWQTWKQGTVVSSGTIGPVPTLAVGTILGFYDPDGFDQLVVRATLAASGDPNLQAIALDSVSVMLNDQPPTPAVSIQASGGIPSLTVWNTLPGSECRLLFTEGLLPPVWNPVPSQQADGWVSGGGTVMFADFGAFGRPERFYRVEVR